MIKALPFMPRGYGSFLLVFSFFSRTESQKSVHHFRSTVSDFNTTDFFFNFLLKCSAAYPRALTLFVKEIWGQVESCLCCSSFWAMLRSQATHQCNKVYANLNVDVHRLQSLELTCVFFWLAVTFVFQCWSNKVSDSHQEHTCLCSVTAYSHWAHRLYVSSLISSCCLQCGEQIVLTGLSLLAASPLSSRLNEKYCNPH